MTEPLGQHSSPHDPAAQTHGQSDATVPAATEPAAAEPSAAEPAVPAAPTVAGRTGTLGKIGVGLAIAFAKFKFLFFPLLKIVPLVVSVWVYGIFYGLPFALLFVALLAIHEAGHYIVMRRMGIDASFPMFIPGLGALIYSKSLTTLSVRRQAIIAYAGPFVGTLGALAFAAYGYYAQSGLWLAAAYTGFFLNAFNLLPVPPFDGSYLARIASDKLWLFGLALFAGLAYAFPGLRNPFVILIVVASIPRVIQAWKERKAPPVEILSMQTRLAFAGAYFGLLAVDLIGMLQTHYRPA